MMALMMAVTTGAMMVALWVLLKEQQLAGMSVELKVAKTDNY